IPAAALVDGEARIVLDGRLQVSAPHSVIDGRSLAANTGAGIVVLDSSFSERDEDGVVFAATADQSVLRAVVVQNMGGVGVVLNGSSADSLTGFRLLENTISHNGYGISLKDGVRLYYTSDSLVRANTITASNGYGLVLFMNNVNNTITANSISGNRNGGLSLERNVHDNLLSDNTISNNPGYGVYLRDNADNNVFRNNTIADNGVGLGGIGVSLGDSNANRFTGNTLSGQGSHGFQLYGSANGNRLEANTIRDNGGHGIYLGNGVSVTYISANTITGQTWAGIAMNGTGVDNTVTQNRIYGNGGLGIDLGADGVTANDEGDVDTGPNRLLNYPEVKAGSFGANGTPILTYDFDLDAPSSPDGYRIEFFRSTDADATGHGEGETYLGFMDIVHPGGGPHNFKGVLNASQAVSVDDSIAVTVTEKSGTDTLGSTSEFSGVKKGGASSVCTNLLSNPDADLSSLKINENQPLVTLLETTDRNGDPISYMISGGVDAAAFIIHEPVPGATFDCSTLEFLRTDDEVVVTRNLSTFRAAAAGNPGDFEAPADAGQDNVYEVQITGVDVHGNSVTVPVQVSVQDVNEKPVIDSPAQVSFAEEGEGAVYDLTAVDSDAGDMEGQGLTYRLNGGADMALFSIDRVTGVLRFVSPPDYEIPQDANGDNEYEVILCVVDHLGYEDNRLLKVVVQDVEESDGVSLRVRAMLQGPYDPEAGLMADNLRLLDLLPRMQPYAEAPFGHAGLERTADILLLADGNDAVVDWVLLELRSRERPALIVAARSALLQRDGDVVDAASGLPVLNFPGLSAGDYFVSLRHRNHLGVMTAQALTLGAVPALVDFSRPDLPVSAGQHGRLESDTLALMWAGDVNHDHRLHMLGSGNDMNRILSSVLMAPGNTGYNSSFL
ncbi:MAG TPA: right-handed parallel beta-helix repeat-containing protein, partial [Thiolinea sp.]|nr:right-handed parallel beta-helix repeat-containing protein [Thiolinea sp.]